MCDEKTITLYSNIKMEAVVISLKKHNDKSYILNLYSREKGREQCMVYGNKWKSLLIPMAIVDIIYTGNTKLSLPSIGSVSLTYVPKRIHLDVKRQCVAMFLAEVVSKTLRHPMADPAVYDYLVKTIQAVDTNDNIIDQPEQFLRNLSVLLGYGGEMLDEWHELKSLEIVQTILA